MTDRDTPLAAPPDGGCIAIHGAREHNLKNISLTIPRGKFVVVTGVSGSGKSTLAFDLVFAEGQRRFLDAMNTYARQFVEQFARAQVDAITGLPPTVSIEQRNSRGGGKSTVATVTEIHHFLRLLFARLGTQHCPDCQQPVEPQTRDELARQLRAQAARRGPLKLLAPVVRNRKGFHSDVGAWAVKNGYAELRADGKLCRADQSFRLDRFKEHNVEIVVGTLATQAGGGVLTAPGRTRGQSRRGEDTAPYPALDSQALIEQTLKLGHGTLFALDARGGLTIHSTERACAKCGRSFAPLDPKNFSYNSAQGWCPKCRGFGELFYLPEVERGANADSIEESWWGWADERESCPECHGARLNPLARATRLAIGNWSSAIRIGGAKAPRATALAPTIDTFGAMSVATAHGFFGKLKLTGRAAEIARDILPEIRERLKFLERVGLHYLELGRGVTTLSGGEAQRIRLAAQLGSNLTGILYVLDEPTIGLHARDNDQLLAALALLRARGNSLLVVEHDEETMRQADYIIDLGPGAGINGGQVVAAGTLRELLAHDRSLTGELLGLKKRYPSRGHRRPFKPGRDAALTLRGAKTNNLRDLTVEFPLQRFVAVTGVSGSGKSTLVRECLLPALQTAVSRSPRRQTPSPNLSGHGSISAVHEVDQSPIGRTPRSTPATYVGFFDDIRALFAQVPEARMRGYGPGRFSFNSPQGRCPECEGAGEKKLEMNFLPPAHVRCETCDGLRFNPSTLEVRFSGRTIAEVLDLSVAEALEFFAAFPRIRRPLEALRDTGLEYLKLGQTSPTLSGGESQRVKLVSHLLTGLRSNGERTALQSSKFKVQGSKLFVLEEPTIGLHMSDVQRLVDVLQRLVDAGHTVIVIEHNLDFIAEADWVIDLGPEGGAGGGRVVAQGAPEQVARAARSHTGRYLRKVLRHS